MPDDEYDELCLVWPGMSDAQPLPGRLLEDGAVRIGVGGSGSGADEDIVVQPSESWRAARRGSIEGGDAAAETAETAAGDAAAAEVGVTGG